MVAKGELSITKKIITTVTYFASLQILGNLWINHFYSVPNQYMCQFLHLNKAIWIKSHSPPGFSILISWKRADCPYIRLWKVFGQLSQANIDLHRRTWHTGDSRSSSTRDIPFSCSQADTLWFGMRVLPCSGQKICDFQCSVPSRLRCHLLWVNS